MSTPTALLVATELEALRENGDLMGWSLKHLDDLTFLLMLPAKDGTRLHLRVSCDGYSAMPPAWHWYNPSTDAVDAKSDTPRGGTFLHSAGVVCAPWNRLAYTTVDARGPHSDWDIGVWHQNPLTGACHSLSAMALRIALELMKSYDGRIAA